MDARPIGDVLIDRLRERVGLLEHHAHKGAKLHHVHAGPVDILAVQRSEEHTSEIQPLMRPSYTVYRLKKKRTEHYSRQRDSHRHHTLKETKRTHKKTHQHY